MSNFNLKELFNLSGEILTRLDKGAFLTTKGQGKNNTMIISWGAIGEIWGKPMMMIMVRKSRYTHDLLENSRDFTVTFAEGDALKEAWKVSGSQSGHQIDKFTQLGLTAKDSKAVAAPIIDTDALQLECKIFYKTDIDAKGMKEADYQEFYADGDIHTLYFAEILEAYETK